MSPIESMNTPGISPNNRNFGVGPGTLKNLFEGIAATVTAVALSALAIGFCLGLYANGATFLAAAVTTGGGVVVSVALAMILYQMIKVEVLSCLLHWL